jgi:hypothetical protein
MTHGFTYPTGIIVAIDTLAGPERLLHHST